MTSHSGNFTLIILISLVLGVMVEPGWHIECPAMALKYLGESIEIHGGGNDLIFPHHENEIAQSESYTGQTLAKIWMHVGMVTINTEKMSKSLGNIVPIKDAVQKWGPNTIRLFCLSVRIYKTIRLSRLASERGSFRNGNKLRYALGNWRTGELVRLKLRTAYWTYAIKRKSHLIMPWKII